MQAGVERKAYYKLAKDGTVIYLGDVSGLTMDANSYFYEWKGKKVTASEFSALLKKESGDKVESSIGSFYENTAANRANMQNLIKK